jgi:hypothetical protein
MHGYSACGSRIDRVTGWGVVEEVLHQRIYVGLTNAGDKVSNLPAGLHPLIPVFLEADTRINVSLRLRAPATSRAKRVKRSTSLCLLGERPLSPNRRSGLGFFAFTPGDTAEVTVQPKPYRAKPSFHRFFETRITEPWTPSDTIIRHHMSTTGRR